MDIEFNQLNDIKQVTKELRKESLGLVNRLQSIIYDCKFIKSINLLDYPLIPNERCGAWYLPPQDFKASTYFKSTDGHTSEWQFSYRRLNLHILPIIKAKNGVVIVDSTRKGKLLPDALSKTVPIWCAVLNCMAFGVDSDKYRYVKLPSFIPETEKSQIIDLIPGFVNEVQRLHLFTVELDKPLVPYWIHPGGKTASLKSGEYHIVCLNASDSYLDTIRVRNDHDEVIEWKYIQGSADDHEMWVPSEVCNGKLTPAMLWDSMDRITDSTGYINLSEAELVKELNNITGQAKQMEVCRIGSSDIHIGAIMGDSSFDLAVEMDHLVVLSSYKITNVPKGIKVHQFPLESNKKGSKALRDVLPKLLPHLNPKTLVICDTGKDLSVAIVLILLIQNYDLNLQPLVTPGRGNKDLVKQFLKVINQTVNVNPSRNTLQSVNTYLSSNSS